MGRNTNRRQLFNLSQAKTYMQTMLVASGCNATDRAGQDHQHPRSVLPAQAHDRRHQGRDLRRPGRVRPGDRGLRGAAEQPPRGAAPLRPETRRHGRRHRRWSTRGDEIDCSRMGSGGYGIPSIVEPEVIQFKKCDGQVHPARRKGHGLAAVQRGQVLAQAQVHPDPRRRPAAARRAAAAAPPAQRTETARLLPAG